MGSWTRALESGRITTLKGKQTTLYQLPPSWARGLEHWNLILDTNPELYFHLQQQRLIELICLGKVDEGLGFAQEELAPREDLEKTVALLAFEDAKNCPLGELLDVSQRLKTASEVNAAILTSQSREQDPKLPSLLKLLIWAQNQLVEKVVFPCINDLSTAALEDPTV